MDGREVPRAVLNPRPPPGPIYSGKIRAGQSRFPSLLQDYEQKTLDLNDPFIASPPATLFFMGKGDPWLGQVFFNCVIHTYRGPLHQARNPSNIVIADVNGAWMVKHLSKRSGTIKLLSENLLKESILLNEGQELVVFGAVT